MLKFLDNVYFDSLKVCISILIQGSCFVFDWDCPLDIGLQGEARGQYL